MEEANEAFLRAVKAVNKAAKAVLAAVKAMNMKPRNPAMVKELASRAVSALSEISGVEGVANTLSATLAREVSTAEAELERERAIFANTVANALKSRGLDVTGNLPRLYASAFTLEFNFGSKGQCTIWFGPKKERIASLPLDAETIASRVKQLDDALFGGDFDEMAFLSELERAYRLALVRRGLEGDGRVPLTAIMVEVAVGRQNTAFYADPRRELFISYGRVTFAAELSRLRLRRLGEQEFRLDIATMAQTRRPEDHIFVPYGRTVEGTNYATAGFWRVS